MADDICSLSIALLCLFWVLRLWIRRHHAQLTHSPTTALRQHLLKPRPPDECPTCRRTRPQPAPASLSPRPWHELKSRRGAPKRIATNGFACPNHACPYHGITDAQVHALVGDGMHAKHERIPTFRCQACGTTFTSRRTTPLYRLKTPSARVAEVLTALVEGLSIAAAMRVFGHSEGTITTWLTRA